MFICVVMSGHGPAILYTRGNCVVTIVTLLDKN